MQDFLLKIHSFSTQSFFCFIMIIIITFVFPQIKSEQHNQDEFCQIKDTHGA